MNIPNTLTFLRILFAVVVFTMIGLRYYDLALLFFVLAAFTDFLDGWWARRFKQITVFGRVMDPFADKFLICGAFVCFVTIPELTSDRSYPSWLMLQAWMVIIIVGRELFVTTLRAFIEESGGDFSAKWIGKCKMAIQCAAVILTLLYLSGGAEWEIVTFDGRDSHVQQYVKPLGGKTTWEVSEDGLEHSNPQWIPVTTQKETALARGLDYVFGTMKWRTVVFFTMLSTFWLTVGITLLSGLDYGIHATRMIRKRRERFDEIWKP